MAKKAELQEQLAELQDQLAVAERKVEDLKAELGSVQAKVACLHEAREADQLIIVLEVTRDHCILIQMMMRIPSSKKKEKAGR